MAILAKPAKASPAALLTPSPALLAALLAASDDTDDRTASAADRMKRSLKSGVILETVTKRSPLLPPPPVWLPSPGTRMRAPSSSPGGHSTHSFTRCDATLRPSHVRQRSLATMITPRPLHSLHSSWKPLCSR